MTFNLDQIVDKKLNDVNLFNEEMKASCKAIFWATFVLYPLYGVFDYVMSPENWKLFFTIRLSHSILIGVLYFGFFKRMKQFLFYQYVLYLGPVLQVSLMCNLVKEEALFNYLIGLDAIFPIAAVVLVWNKRHIIVSSLIILLSYLAFYLVLKPEYSLQFLLDKGGVLFVSLLIVSAIIQMIRHANLRKLTKSKLLLDLTIAREKQANLKMNLLSKQINPHYIFNVFASLQSLVKDSESEKAASYIGKYSDLIRASLHDETRELISLEEELEVLKAFLELESLRGDRNFDYTINWDETIQPGSVTIPAFLMQPFVENSIYHGVRHLTERRGQITINCSTQRSGGVKIEIIDNGIGIEASKQINSKREKHKSTGISNTYERVRILNELFDVDVDINTESVSSKGECAGTKVVITLSF